MNNSPNVEKYASLELCLNRLRAESHQPNYVYRGQVRRYPPLKWKRKVDGGDDSVEVEQILPTDSIHFQSYSQSTSSGR